MNPRNISLRILTLVLAICWAPALKAQLNRGVLEGVVVDAQGGVVPGVDVTVTSVERNEVQTVKTNSAGYYRVEALIPGKYRAHFVATGFSAEEIVDIEVLAGQLIREDATLKVGAVLQQIEVTAAPALVETSASNFSTTIGASTVENIPLAGRDLQQLVFLFPGVNSTAGPPGSNFGFNSQYGTFPDPTHVEGSDLSVNGGQAGANAWYLDGNLDLSGLDENLTVNPSPDAVAEFQVITEAFSPEYGRTGGAAFNVVLKSGTNKTSRGHLRVCAQRRDQCPQPLHLGELDRPGDQEPTTPLQQFWRHAGRARSAPAYLQRQGQNLLLLFLGYYHSAPDRYENLHRTHAVDGSRRFQRGSQCCLWSLGRIYHRGAELTRFV